MENHETLKENYYKQDIYGDPVMSKEIGEYILANTGSHDQVILWGGCASYGKTSTIRSFFGDNYKGEVYSHGQTIYDMGDKGIIIEIRGGSPEDVFCHMNLNIHRELNRYEEIRSFQVVSNKDIEKYIAKRTSLIITQFMNPKAKEPKCLIEYVSKAVITESGKVEIKPVFKLDTESSGDKFEHPVWKRYDA